MKYPLFKTAEVSRFICLSSIMRFEYEIASHEGLDAPTVLPAGSTEGYLDYDGSDWWPLEGGNIGYGTTFYRE